LCKDEVRRKFCGKFLEPVKVIYEADVKTNVKSTGAGENWRRVVLNDTFWYLDSDARSGDVSILPPPPPPTFVL
jgi:hypothetical protein